MACSASSRSETAGAGDSALAYVNAQVAFGPRVPGTPSHERAGDWIAAHLQSRCDTALVQRWTQGTTHGDSLPLRNFLGRFQPQLSNRVLYVAHWDTRPVAEKDPNVANRDQPIAGANDGASGVALLLAVADLLARTPPTVGVDLLFVDGEDYGDFSDPGMADVLLGSRHFAEHVPDSAYRPLFGVVWDMIGDRNLTVAREPLSMRGAPEVVELVWRTAEALGHGDVFVRRVTDPILDDHVPLLQAGLHVIDVIDLDYRGPGGQNYHHTLADTPDKVSANSLQVMVDVAMALVREP